MHRGKHDWKFSNCLIILLCVRMLQAKNVPQAPAAEPEPEPIEPVGESVYDALLTKSVNYRPVTAATATANGDDTDSFRKKSKVINVMPLVQVLREGAKTKDAGWHRNEERLARGIAPVTNLGNKLEAWENQLVSFSYPCISSFFLCVRMHKFHF